jgi:AcrR family transcriptional regulator
MENLRDSIIVTADRMFQQFGIRSVSIDNVCAELRISKKTFYTYFTQKEDLIDSVLTFQREQNIDKYEKLFKNRNAIDSLIIIIREIKRNTDHESQRMCRDLEKYYPKINAKYELHQKEIIRLGFDKNLRQGITEGYYREDLDVELISYFHSIQIKMMFEQMSQDAKKFSKKRLVDFIIDLIIHLIANEKGLKYIEEQAARDNEK